MDTFPDQVPPTMEFQIGYFAGKQSAKYWLMCQEDLELMYKSVHGKKSVLLWCDARDNSEVEHGESSVKCRKRKSSSPSPEHRPSKRQLLEDKVDKIVSELKEKHESKYGLPQLRLWARMIVAGNHESTDEAPQIPAITGVPSKQAEKKDTLSNALAGAAATIVSALQSPASRQSHVNASNSVVISTESPPLTPTKSSSSNNKSGISPGKSTELRFKKLKELRELQQLLNDNILTTEEFVEQKKLVLESLQSLTH